MTYKRFLVSMAAMFVALSFVTKSEALTSDALLNKLVQKGILTTQEADELRSEDKTNAMYSSKWKISNSIKDMELFGDIKFRYESRDGTTPAGNTLGRDRWRYALKIGVRGDLRDQFYYALRLETSPNPRSPWVTFGDSTAFPYQGPFSKNSGGIYIGQLYLGWHPYDWVDFSVGRMPNPLYTTPMVWDNDICPEGMSERFKVTAGKFDLFATFGQFLYQAVNPNSQVNSILDSQGGVTSNPFMLTWQLGANYHFNKDMSLKAAPTLYNYIGHGNQVNGFYGAFVGQGTNTPDGGNYASASTFTATNASSAVQPVFNQTGINNLFIFELPAELDFKLGRLDARFFGDFAMNLDGDDRARAAYKSGLLSGAVFPGGLQVGQNMAYQFGFAVGNNVGQLYGQESKKGSWEARAYWQHVEQYALDPNLLDSDFFEGRGNMEGLYTGISYCFADNVTGALRYGYANRINKDLGTGGLNADLPWLNPITKYEVLQVDLSMRF